MRTRTAAGLFACGWLVLLLAACSVPPASALRLGSTLWTYQGASSVFTAAWSPDGKYLALGDADGTVQIRDAVTGKLTFSLYGHTGAVWALAWSPDSMRIASAGSDRTVQVWNATNGEPLLTYRGQSGTVAALAWSPGGTRIASAGFDHTVQVWDASTGEHAFTYRGHTSYVWTLAWSPDGTRIASGIRRCKCGRQLPGAGSLPIAVIAVSSVRSPGRQMGSVSLR